jgi:periplasmic divalent cation tolerance protein
MFLFSVRKVLPSPLSLLIRHCPLTTDSRFYMTDKRIVLTTASSEEEARKIARHLLEHRLAACVNLVPQVASIYLWQGKIEEAGEWLLVIKTTAATFGQVRQAIADLHSYELPECICLTIEDGSPSYLQWIAESVSSGDSGE